MPRSPAARPRRTTTVPFHPALADYCLFPAAFKPATASGPLSINAPHRLETTLTFTPAQQARIQAPSSPNPPDPVPKAVGSPAPPGSSLTWTAELYPGTYSGPDAIASSRFQVEALQSLRQPWFVTPVPSPSPTKDVLPVLSREQPAPGSLPSQK